MSRIKLFLENFFAYGFINVLNKIIPLLLLPVITRMLTDPSDFGVYDMYNLIIGFGSPLAMLGMYDAMFREFFEKDDEQYRYNVTSTANRIVLVTSTLMGGALLIFNNSFSKLFFGTSQYGNIVTFSALSLFISANSSIVAAPTRIQNQRKIYIASGLLHSISYYLVAIGLIYYGYSFFGMIYANIITALVLFIFFWRLNKSYFMLGKYDNNIAKELLKIGLPLLPTFLIYWVYNSMDKIMITNMLGTTELGIYSIGSKLASISQFIYTAFAGGWSYFAFSTMKDEDQVALNSKVFEYLGAISFLSLFAIYPFIGYIFNFLFPVAYLTGQVVVPYLYLSPLLLMLFQVAGSQFLVIKKSYWSTISLSLGAVVNVILNFILIKLLGIEGAAIATLIGYIVTIIMVCIITSSMKIMNISKRFLVGSILIIGYIFVCRIFIQYNIVYQVVLSTVIIGIYLVMYKGEIKVLLRQGINMLKPKIR